MAMVLDAPLVRLAFCPVLTLLAESILLSHGPKRGVRGAVRAQTVGGDLFGRSVTLQGLAHEGEGAALSRVRVT
jgi:hypothetical protein